LDTGTASRLTVSIVGGSFYTANRKGEYFHWPLTVANATAQYPTVSAVSQYGGDPDSGEGFVPPGDGELHLRDRRQSRHRRSLDLQLGRREPAGGNPGVR
jgi:hypothetical protein